MIFARKFDDNLAGLVKKFETVAGENEDKNFTVLVLSIGGEVEALKSAAADFASTHDITKAIVVVPSEQPNGPKAYGISEDVETAVFLYKGKKVTESYIFTGGQELSQDRATEIVAGTDKILK